MGFVSKESSGTNRQPSLLGDKLRFLYENEGYQGAWECKFEVKVVSELVGKGVFTTEHMKKGSIIWDESKHLNKSYTLVELEKWLDESPELAPEVLKFGYMWDDRFYLPLDSGKWCNHSKTSPSTTWCKTIEELADLRGVPVESVPKNEFSIDYNYAARDLQPGDELTEDYTDSYHEPAGYVELCRKHNIISIVEIGRMF